MKRVLSSGGKLSPLGVYHNAATATMEPGSALDIRYNTQVKPYYPEG